MIRVEIEIRDETGRSLIVEAECIEQALALAGASNPGDRLRLVFPIDPETFFIDRAPEPVGSGRSRDSGPRLSPERQEIR